MTTAFRTAWSKLSTRKPVALLHVDLGTFQLYAATTSVRVGGQHYEPILGAGAVSDAGGFMSTTMSFSTCTLTLIDKRTSFVGVDGGLTTTGLFSEYDWVGAAVTVSYWEQSLSDPADALVKFVGVVSSWRVRTGEVEVGCTQSMAFNKSITPVKITKAKYPQAPDSSIGQALPTYYGNCSAPPMRAPWLSEYGVHQRAHELITGGRRAGRAFLVDTGRGTGLNAKIVVAGHPCQYIGNLNPSFTGCGVFLAASDGTLHALEIPSGSFFNSTDECGFYLTDGTAVGRAPLFPTKWVAGTVNGPENANVISDSGVEYASTRINITPGTYIKGTLPTIESPGTLTQFALVVAYTSPKWYTNLSAASYCSGPFKVALRRNGTDVWSLNITDTTGFPTTTPTGAVPGPQVVIYPFSISGSIPSDFASIGGCELVCSFGAGSTDTSGLIDILFCGLAGYYVPNQTIVDSTKTFSVVPVPRAATSPFPTGTDPSIVNTYVQRQLTSGTTEMDGRFYANVRGWQDDASGTITGTPLALVERIPDVVRHMLTQYGGAADADFVTGTGSVGSFIDARSGFKTWANTDMVLGFSFAQQIQMSTLLAWVMAAGACDVWRSPSDAKWRIAPWASGVSASYPRALKVVDVLDPATAVEVNTTPVSDVISAVDVNFGRDEVSGSYAHTTSAAADLSHAGYRYRSLRDGDGTLTITRGVNDMIDFGYRDGAATLPMSLRLYPGSYDVDSFATMVKRVGLDANYAKQFNVLYGVNRNVSIKAPLTHGAGDTTVTAYLTANQWLTFTELAVAIQTRINASLVALGATWTVSVSLTANREFLVTSGSPDGLDLDLTGTESMWPQLLFPTQARSNSHTSQPWGVPWSVGFNGVVTSTVNDTIPVQLTSGGPITNITIVGGVYTMEGLAAAAQAALNAVSSGFTVSFSRTTGKFTFARAAGFALAWNNGAGADATASTLFGWPVQNQAWGTSITSAWPVGDELQFSVAGREDAARGGYPTGTFYLAWRTGAHGLLGDRTCAVEPFGFDPQQDDWALRLRNTQGDPVDGYRHLGVAPRFVIESILGAADDRYGSKVPVQIDGRCINDTRTAIELRNRLVAIMSKARGQVSFSTETCPDLERGDTFTFGGDMDGLRPYGIPGTGGLWSGRVFRVTEQHSRWGDTWHTEVGAVDLTD